MKSFNILTVFIICMLVFSCVEEIPLNTQTVFDEVLVIEGTVTNELKHQIIKLSKSFRLETEGPSSVSNATVIVNDELGNSFNFVETDGGVYSSNSPFAAQPSIKYTLEVIENGITYTSTPESFIQPTQIDQLYLERDFNENNEEGISIYINTFDPTGNSKHYRYEYEETYKIIAPKYSPLKLIINDHELPVSLSNFSSIEDIQDYFVSLVPRDEQVRICYNTVKSNTILITDTNNFTEDRLEKHRVRFISRENPIMSHRYSIIVKQYTQSSQANSFYNVLKSFSLSESIFSENQLGFLEGNVSANMDQINNKVVGYFQVSPVDSERIYFNYEDLFPNEELPPYFNTCPYYIPLLFKADPLTNTITESNLVNALEDNFQYFSANPEIDPELSGPIYPFLLYPEPCGDCTVLGSTNIPNFWQE